MIAARKAALEQDWWHTAAVLCQFYHAHKDKNSPRRTVESFNPFAEPAPVKRRDPTPADMEALFGPQR